MEDIIEKLQDAAMLRLHLGELTSEELLVAKAAVRFALAKFKDVATPVAGCIRTPNAGKMCDPFMATDVLDQSLWNEQYIIPLYSFE